MRVGNLWAASAIVLAGSFGSPAFAQNQELAPPTNPDEIIVTAEKRAQSIDDIPSSISAFSGDELAETGVDEMADLRMVAPSLQFGRNSTDTYVSIRGIGAELRDIGVEPGVTISQDGMPYTSQYMYNGNFLDLGRVEVLRGPQGTISGRNATGGAINLHSKRPTVDFEGGVSLEYGNYDRIELGGYASGPILGGILGGRISARTQQSDGWLYNSFLDVHDNNQDIVEVRGSLLFTPSAAYEAFLVLERSIDRSHLATRLEIGRARPEQPSLGERFGLPGLDAENLVYQSEWPTSLRRDGFKAILNQSLDLGRGLSLASVTGYANWSRDGVDDFDGTAVAASQYELDVDIEQFSQELTLAADLAPGIDMLAGGLYIESESIEFVSLGLPALGVPTGAITLDGDQDLTSWAIYSQWRFDLADALRLTVGGRYTRDTKNYATVTTVFGTPAPFGVKASWDAFTPRVALDYNFNDGSLIYATVARGFKAGGYNTFGAGNPEFQPEFVWNYEVGAKANFLDNRLRTAISAFHMDYKNLQQSLFQPDPDSNLQLIVISNASSATINGVELEIDAAITPRLSLRTSGSWLDATYDELTSGDTLYPELGDLNSAGDRVRDLSGNRITRVPEFQFSIGAKYTTPLSDKMQSVLRADYFWQDDVFFTFFNYPLLSQDSYGLFNGSVTFETVDGRWSIGAYVTNFFDTRYVTSSLVSNATSNGLIGEPRRYGVRLRAKF